MPSNRLLDCPVRLFVLLSLLFGTAIVAINPPFRGADEPAHYLRAYAFAAGELVPHTDAEGHRGTYLRAKLAAPFMYFRDALYAQKPLAYRQLMADYFTAGDVAADAPPVFVTYDGSEQYSPAGYLPYIAAALVGRLLKLGFLPLLYLMRLSGLLIYTAVVAYAIAAVGVLRWPLLLIALLPANLYARASVSEDAAAFAYALAVLALCVQAAIDPQTARAGPRSVWMTLCVLTKPPQIAFVLLEAMAAPLRTLASRWRTVALVTMPAVALLALWIVGVGADAGAAWRMADATNPPAHMTYQWKLGFMLAHPLRFPTMLLGSFTDDPLELWREVIGVLGWLTDPLHPMVYAALTFVLVLVLFDRLDLPGPVRWRLAAVSSTVAVLYALAAGLALFLAWSRLDVARIDGLQGRYFEICLPLIAVALSAACNVRLTGPAIGRVALAGAVISGCGTIEAIVRCCWLVPRG